MPQLTEVNVGVLRMVVCGLAHGWPSQTVKRSKDALASSRFCLRQINLLLRFRFMMGGEGCPLVHALCSSANA
jgi:hypothetical protein